MLGAIWRLVIHYGGDPLCGPPDVLNAALSRFSTATATEHGCCLIPQCPWIANFLERHCYRAWLSSDQGDVCSALSRDLVLSTCRLAVKMQMPTFPMWLRISHCKLPAGGFPFAGVRDKEEKDDSDKGKNLETVMILTKHQQ